MTVTYNPALPDNRDKVRRAISDTVENSGPLPGDANFQDAELEGLITAEGAWQRAVAACFEALAAAWTKYPSHTADGVSISNSNVAEGYREDAERWRKQWGYGDSGRFDAGVILLDFAEHTTDASEGE